MKRRFISFCFVSFRSVPILQAATEIYLRERQDRATNSSRIVAMSKAGEVRFSCLASPEKAFKSKASCAILNETSHHLCVLVCVLLGLCVCVCSFRSTAKQSSGQRTSTARKWSGGKTTNTHNFHCS
eukprot:COSAG06_NODE_3179_length_5724_cov_88.554489_3_plen_127_part_00